MNQPSLYRRTQRVQRLVGVRKQLNIINLSLASLEVESDNNRTLSPPPRPVDRQDLPLRRKSSITFINIFLYGTNHSTHSRTTLRWIWKWSCLLVNIAMSEPIRCLRLKTTFKVKEFSWRAISQTLLCMANLASSKQDQNAENLPVNLIQRHSQHLSLFP